MDLFFSKTYLHTYVAVGEKYSKALLYGKFQAKNWYGRAHSTCMFRLCISKLFLDFDITDTREHVGTI